MHYWCMIRKHKKAECIKFKLKISSITPKMCHIYFLYNLLRSHAPNFKSSNNNQHISKTDIKKSKIKSKIEHFYLHIWKTTFKFDFI